MVRVLYVIDEALAVRVPRRLQAVTLGGAAAPVRHACVQQQCGLPPQVAVSQPAHLCTGPAVRHGLPGTRAVTEQAYPVIVSAAESVQKKGMDGVDLAKRWLESTTWIELPFDSYNNGPVCTLRRLDGKLKGYDLFGSIHQDPPIPLYVEVKDYDSAGGKQGKEFWEFLANAYSITAQDFKDGLDARREFMWITRHPFNTTDWVSLTSAERIKTALEEHHPEVLNGESINANLLGTVSDRLYLLVVHKRQEGFMLTPEELALVESKLNRKGKK